MKDSRLCAGNRELEWYSTEVIVWLGICNLVKFRLKYKVTFSSNTKKKHDDF